MSRSDQSSPATSFRHSVAILLSGTIIVQVISFVCAPILARLYGPAAFGSAGIFESIAMIVGVAVCWRFELAVMLPPDDDSAADLVVVSLVAMTITGIAASVCLGLVGGYLTRWLRAPALAPLLWLLPLSMMIRGVTQALLQWNNRMQRYGRQAFAQVLGTVVANGCQMASGLAGQATPSGLVYGATLGLGAMAAVYGWSWQGHSREGSSGLTGRGWRAILAVARRYRRFPLIDTWGSLVNILAYQLPTLMLSRFFTPAAVGGYYLVFRLVQIPMVLLGNSIGQVMYQRLCQARSEGRRVSDLVLPLFERLLGLSMVPGLLGLVAGKELCRFVFGAPWEQAGAFLQLFSPFAIALFVSVPLSFIYLAFERQGQLLVFNLVFLAAAAATLASGAMIFRDINLTLGMFALAGAVLYGWLTAGSLRIAGVPRTAAARILLKQCALAAVGAAPVALFKYVFHWPQPAVLAACGSVLLIYGAVLFRWLRPTDLRSYLVK